jgi:23S rRNA pseudouridine1911/1915/1917 synthase
VGTRSFIELLKIDMTVRMLDQVDKIQHGEPDSRQRPQPQEGPLTILHEDEAVVVLDKPPGIVVHPTYKNTTGTLLNAVLWRYRDRPEVQPGILTRLDKDTSGVVVIALTPGLHATMQREMGSGRVKKEYLAVVCGNPEPSSGRIALPLGRSSEDRRVVVVREDGARCVTDYDVVERWSVESQPVAMVRCELLTGRTHQIRVHLAASGWPIMGDTVYGQRAAVIPRQALHAWRVTLPHPITREMLTVTARLPRDIESIRLA